MANSVKGIPAFNAVKRQISTMPVKNGKNKATIPSALLEGQLTLFGGFPEYCPLNQRQKSVASLIGRIRNEKEWMKWALGDTSVFPDLTVNEVLDGFLGQRKKLALRLKKLGHAYVEDEEDHPYYKRYVEDFDSKYAVQLNKPRSNTPF